MLKKILSLLLAVTALLTFCGCAQNTEGEDLPDGSLRFNNDAADYTFVYTDDWSVDYQTGISSLQKNTAGSSVAATYARISVMAFDGGNCESAREYWQSYKAEIKANYGSFAVDKESIATDDNGNETEGIEIKLDDAAALRVKYTADLNRSDDTSSESIPYTFEQVICLRNGSMYILTFSAREGDYDTCLAGFEQVINSFEFKKDLINNLF